MKVLFELRAPNPVTERLEQAKLALEIKNYDLLLQY